MELHLKSRIGKNSKFMDMQFHSKYYNHVHIINRMETTIFNANIYPTVLSLSVPIDHVTTSSQGLFIKQFASCIACMECSSYVVQVQPLLSEHLVLNENIIFLHGN